MQRRLGREDGELRVIAERLREWGVLDEATESTKGRRVYVFNAAWEKQLDLAIRRASPTWWVGQRILFVRPSGVTSAARKLGDAVDDQLVWGVGLRDGRGLLLGLNETIADASAQRLQGDLVEEAGAVDLATVEEALPASELQEYGRALAPDDS
jgi:hypothetical protein